MPGQSPMYYARLPAATFGLYSRDSWLSGVTDQRKGPSAWEGQEPHAGTRPFHQHCRAPVCSLAPLWWDLVVTWGEAHGMSRGQMDVGSSKWKGRW